MKDINKKNYTKKCYEFSTPEGNVEVCYEIDFTFGSQIQAIAEYEVYDENGDYICGTNSWDRLKFAAYDYPKFEIEIELRNKIAERIAEELDFELDYGDWVPNNDLGIDALYDNPYFVESKEAFENEEDDY